jgi:glycerophosphoryl diester phosphodiesterase
VLRTGFHVIAHRGGAGEAPENTLAAFERARDQGVREVELDVRLSRDGELVLFHDEELDAKTALHGRVEEHAASTLLAADIGSWFDAHHPSGGTRYAGTTLTTLGALLDHFGSALDYHVELKGTRSELPSRVADALREHGGGCTVIVSAFSFDELARAAECAPERPTCLLLRDAPGWLFALPAARRAAAIASHRERIDRAAEAGFTRVAVRASLLSPEVVRHAQERSIGIRAWGVDSDDALEHAVAVGAEGATVDWPRVLLDRLQARGIPPAEGALA